MILVIGATGNIGGRALRDLAAQGVAVRALSRDPSKLPALGDHVEVVPGDLEHPHTIAAALDGVDKVLLCAASSNPMLHEAAVIRQAGDAGVEHMVMVSSFGVEYGVGSGPAHQPGEVALRSSALAWTILRGMAYMTNALRWRDTIRSSGAFYEPTGSGRYAMIDPADIGAVAAKVLTESGHDAKTYDLTGPEALSSDTYAAKLAAAVGRPIRHVDIPAEAFEDAMLKAGVPQAVVEPVAGFYALVKAGRLQIVTPTVEQILGAPATTFDAWAQRNAGAFR